MCCQWITSGGTCFPVPSLLAVISVAWLRLVSAMFLYCKLTAFPLALQVSREADLCHSLDEVLSFSHGSDGVLSTLTQNLELQTIVKWVFQGNISFQLFQKNRENMQVSKKEWGGMCQRLSSYLTKQHGGDVCLLEGSELFQYSFSRELESISVFHDRRLLGFVEFHLNFGNELTPCI